MVWLIALAWGLVALCCRIGIQLIRKNGRSLLYLDSLQPQLTELQRSSAQPLAAPAMLPTPADLAMGTVAPAGRNPYPGSCVFFRQFSCNPIYLHEC